MRWGSIYRINNRGLRILLLFLLLAGGGGVTGATQNARAQSPETRHVTISLVPENSRPAPGQDFRVAVVQSIDPEWHTYWRNPGDSGTAMKIRWTLPDGFKEKSLGWPVPERIPTGPLVNFGYAGEAVFVQSFTPPRRWPEGPVTFTADIELLVCKDICIPEISRHSFTLNDPSAPAPDPSLIARALEAIPVLLDARALHFEKDGALVLTLSSADSKVMNALKMGSADLFPEEWGVIENTARTSVSSDKDSVTLVHARGVRPLAEVGEIRAVIAFPDGRGSRRGIEIVSKPDPSRPVPPSSPPSSVTENNDGSGLSAPPSALSSTAIAPPGEGRLPGGGSSAGSGLAMALVFAVLGGLILNLMPCVFPVLSIKALGLVRLAEKHPEKARAHGLAYTAGVVLSFVAIAGLLIALKAGGSAIGWGFQLQSPIVVTLLALLLFALGLNLMGVFEMSFRLPRSLHKSYAESQGLAGSFLTGILATLVATPCTAPFMGAAMGYAALQSSFVALGVFVALGMGLALPYLALSFIPALQRRLPRPGAWMAVFRQFLAFPMFASAAWLVWVLAHQSGSAGVLGALAGMIALAFGIWVLQLPAKTERGAWVLRILAALAFAGAIESALWVGRQSAPPAPFVSRPSPDSRAPVYGEVFSPDALKAILSGTEPVFVEMTAAWCITCKVNHQIALNISATRDLFARRGVRYLIGDWTNADPAITAYLESFGRTGVPLYVWYGPPDGSGLRPAPVVLPQILTAGIVRDVVDR